MIGIIGLGFVGGAMLKCFQLKKIHVTGYDKYKNNGINNFEDILDSKILFLCLPTLFDENRKEYNKDAILEVCKKLNKYRFKGIVVIKSTVEPGTTDNLSDLYKNLEICHNPEFLSAKTAFEDFCNQKHIVLGKGKNCTKKKFEDLVNFYKNNFNESKISKCASIESETMKIFCNSFYASKIIIFNEYYTLCEKINCNFNNVTNLMISNNWINKMHTSVPGHDGKLGYGGACFPKDTNALNEFMKKNNVSNLVLDNVIKSNNLLRK